MQPSFCKKQKQMRRSWNNKAEVNAYHWVDSTKDNWNKADYYEKGNQEIKKYVINFLNFKGFNFNDLKKIRALDIGCGTGRLTRAMANYFNFVYGVDISQKMLKKARKDNSDLTNVAFNISNGYDLSDFTNSFFDFVFSFIVFQHIPNKNIVNNYLKDIYRILNKDGLMKVQVRNKPGGIPLDIESWRYKGFNSFYIALSRKKNLPFPIIKRYNTVYGCFYKSKELENIATKIGFKDINVFPDKNNHKYLWMTAQK